MANENIFLFNALVMGIFITFVYDVLRIFRRIVSHNNFWVSVEDMCFWIYCAAEVFLMMYHESDGTLRWFAVLGALIGMILYKKLVSPLFVKYVSLALRKVFGVLGKVIGFLCKPLKKLFKMLKNMTVKAKRGALRQGKNTGKLLKKKLTFLVKMLKMTV